MLRNSYSINIILDFSNHAEQSIRSIRHAQEITTIFKFSPQSRDLTQLFAPEIKAQVVAPAINDITFD